ncbi:threonine-phosphate decarboxylase CobD [Pseudomonas citronellolis]|uniref:threonine-phosphate decarboxylase CobD n=1 Tax=Pseudomonas citronellolis TaxID=53408 RepID=UPI0023E3881F|nr:threonine-phosphate decarboxylase CobD [Pseudomonas citronellolis]MDF3932849.1 threonine-phosphate decarboxylase CobD [Pseudomonas citronellolis]
MLEHGGKLRVAARRYGIPLEDWLDLSTGIAPWPWPLATIPPSAWQRLPEDDDGLERAASAYYGCASLLPVAGSQAAIQSLPRLRAAGRVGVLAPCYAEHAAAWRACGHELLELADEQVDGLLDQLDVLLLVNPNNPTGRRFDPERLLAWHARLSARGGWLVVDEAFMDATPERSLLPLAGGQPGLLVLRSLGKFFGLAGARLGFVFAEAQLLQRLATLLGPWSISGPTRWVAQQALADTALHELRRAELERSGARLAGLLAEHRLLTQGTTLFQWLAYPRAAELHEHLARRGILVRHFDTPPSLRFGLPADESGWARLRQALGEWSPT